MIWDSWAAFIDMGGRGFYVWMSYGFAAAAVLGEIILLRRRRAAALSTMQEHQDDH